MRFHLVEKFRITFSSPLFCKTWLRMKLWLQKETPYLANPDLENGEDPRRSVGTIPADIRSPLLLVNGWKRLCCLGGLHPSGYIHPWRDTNHIYCCSRMCVCDFKACFYMKATKILFRSRSGMNVHKSSPYLVGKIDHDDAVIGVEAYNWPIWKRRKSRLFDEVHECGQRWRLCPNYCARIWFLHRLLSC